MAYRLTYSREGAIANFTARTAQDALTRARLLQVIGYVVHIRDVHGAEMDLAALANAHDLQPTRPTPDTT